MPNMASGVRITFPTFLNTFEELPPKPPTLHIITSIETLTLYLIFLRFLKTVNAPPSHEIEYTGF